MKQKVKKKTNSQKLYFIQNHNSYHSFTLQVKLILVVEEADIEAVEEEEEVVVGKRNIIVVEEEVINLNKPCFRKYIAI